MIDFSRLQLGDNPGIEEWLDASEKMLRRLPVEARAIWCNFIIHMKMREILPVPSWDELLGFMLDRYPQEVYENMLLVVRSMRATNDQSESEMNAVFRVFNREYLERRSKIPLEAPRDDPLGIIVLGLKNWNIALNRKVKQLDKDRAGLLRDNEALMARVSILERDIETVLRENTRMRGEVMALRNSPPATVRTTFEYPREGIGATRSHRHSLRAPGNLGRYHTLSLRERYQSGGSFEHAPWT